MLAAGLTYPLWKLGLLISIYSLGSGLAQAPLGVISDKYNRAYILPTGIGVAGAGYLLFGAAPVLGGPFPTFTLAGFTVEGIFLVMLLAMLIIGVGTAVTHPVGYPLISDNVSEGNKGKILGAFGSSSKFGDATAPAIIAGLILLLTWDQILFVLGSLGIVYAVALFWVLHGDEYTTVPKAVDAGTEDDPDENSSKSIREADNRTYLYPMLIIYFFFITKKFSSKGVQTFFAAFFVGVYSYSFQFMDVSLGAESVANLYFSSLYLFGAVTQLGMGGLTDRLDSRAVLVGCLTVATIALLLFALVNLGPVLLLIVLLFLGAGMWGLNPARDALISDISPPEREGRTFGYLWTAVQMSGVVIPPIVGYVLETTGMRTGVMYLSAGTALGAIALSLLFFEQVYTPEPTSGISSSPTD